MKWLFKIPVVGDVLTTPFYLLFRITESFGFWISGYERIKCGACVIWAPGMKKQAILDGIELLRKCDPEVYRRLTGRSLTIYYSGRWRGTNLFGRYSALNERYIRLGVQGVALLPVQSLFLSEACPSTNQTKFDSNRHGVLRKVLEWIAEHLFHPGLVDSYRAVVEAWEIKC